MNKLLCTLLVVSSVIVLNVTAKTTKKASKAAVINKKNYNEGKQSLHNAALVGGIFDSPCDNSYCHYHGDCVEFIENMIFRHYKFCYCNQDYTGLRCDIPINAVCELYNDACQENYLCKDLVNGYKCLCKTDIVHGECVPVE